MQEALEIMHRLLAGEKVTFHGEYYTTETAKLYSPPKGSLPILMAAGGPKSAAFAGAYADGLITSVKDPADTVAKVIEPYRKAATEVGKEHRVLATRWTVLADGPEPGLARRCRRCAACEPPAAWRRPTRPSSGSRPTRWTGPRCSPATRSSPTRPA